MAMLSASPALADVPTDTGYRGVWYSIGQANDFGPKYSGGLGTYTAKHCPMAIYSEAADKTFFVWGGSEADNPRRLRLMVAYYDHETGEVCRPRIVRDFAQHPTSDAHANPSIALDAAGHVYVFAATRHRVPGRIFRGTRPHSLDEFEEIDPGYIAYPQPWHVPDRGFLLLHTVYQQNKRNLYWMTSDDGKTWATGGHLVAHGHYQISTAAGGVVMTAWNDHPRGNVNARTNLHFAMTKDRGQSWTNSEGKVLDLPIRGGDQTAQVRRYLDEDRLVYLKDINLDEAGRPIILYITSADSAAGPQDPPRQWTVAHWTGQAWRFNEIAPAHHNYDVGSIYCESDGSWRLIAPTHQGPQPWATGGEVAMWTSEDQGRNWRLVRQLTRGSEYNHGYVRRPHNAHEDFYAFWCDGDGLNVSPSRLYFCDRAGNVFRLPEDMKGQNHAKPEPVQPKLSEGR